MVVVGGYADTSLSKVAHPPSDRHLLLVLAGSKEGTPDQRAMWSDVSWTTIGEDRYFEVVRSLRDVVGREPFWTIERYWRG